MTNGLWRRCAPLVSWWIRRNPLYLLSAVAMAVGARLYLVTPDAPAGEIGLILLTLGVLQLYEIAVSAILLTLHRFRRSPEDLPSLLLVAALFWTGPLAATVEMTARHGGVGLGFAAAAAIIALSEMAAIQRELKLTFSRWAQALATACLLLIAFLPARLRAPFKEGHTDEIALYAAWWALAFIAMLVLPALRRTKPAQAGPFMDSGDGRWLVEPAFMGVVLTATAFHLYGMNYAFFGHARAFYVAPLLAVAGLVFAGLAARFRRESQATSLPLPLAMRAQYHAMFAAGLLAPLVGVGLSLDTFDRKFPAEALLPVANDPLVTALLLAALVWWIVARQLSAGPVLVHAGSAAVALAAWRIVQPWLSGPVADSALVGFPVASPDMALGLGRNPATAALFAICAYLLVSARIRRSPGECLAALTALLLAIFLLVWQRTPLDEFIVAASAGWACLIAVWVWRREFELRAASWPVALLVATACIFDFDDAARWPARLHAVAMPITLVVIAWRWRLPQLRIAGYAAAGASLTFLLARAIAGGSNTAAGLTVLCAFALLAGGAALSWHKRRLLRFETRDA